MVITPSGLLGVIAPSNVVAMGQRTEPGTARTQPRGTMGTIVSGMISSTTYVEPTHVPVSGMYSY